MQSVNHKEYLWSQKYRPQIISDCILPNNIKQIFLDMVKQGEICNLLLSGSAGIGKTTVAKALCNEIGVDSYIINASENGNIDTLRTNIKNYASTVSLMNDKPKVVILDEADYLNPQSTQPALRGFIEEYSKNCRFILTCNFKNRLIEPLHSRCTCIDFKIVNGEKQKMAAAMLERCKFILDSENVKYDPRAVAELIIKHFPDFRRIINELQRYSSSGKIDAGILTNLSESKLNELVGFLKGKEFTACRKWVVDNIDTDFAMLVKNLYNILYDKLAPQSVPKAVLVMADYSYKSAFVADQEINTMAMLTEIMCESEWK